VTPSGCAVVAATPTPPGGLDALADALWPRRPGWVVLPALEAALSPSTAIHQQLEAMAARLHAVVVVGLAADALPPNAVRHALQAGPGALGTAVYLPSGFLGFHASTVAAAPPPGEAAPPPGAAAPPPGDAAPPPGAAAPPPGDEPPPVVHLPGGARLGVLAPGELGDPALCAYLAKRGAQVIVAPRAAGGRRSRARRNAPELARARASEAGVALVVVGPREAAIALPDGSLVGASGPGGSGRALAALPLHNIAPPTPAASAAMTLWHREHPERPRPWALARHTPPTAPPHLDLFLARGGFVRAFRLEQLPAAGDPVHATRAFDHRPIYLDFEGSLSEGRGTIHRLGGGTHRILEETADRWTLELSGDGPLTGRLVVPASW